jgi:glycosyltransferase involved in cell wall biosynthesis
VKVHQLVATAAPRDAVTAHALRWRDALRGGGVDGSLLAEHVAPGAPGDARTFRRGLLDPDDGVVLHYSIASTIVPAALAHRGPRLAYYQNVTPGHLLRRYNPSIADLCDRARAGLGELAQLDAVAAPSAFNAADLERAGVRNVTVLPLGFDVGDPPTRELPDGAPTIISVGRIAPNKRLEDVIRVFALFQRHRAPGASLHLVGSSEGFDTYHLALIDLVERLGASRVHLHGSMSDAERDSLYAGADAYLCMSVHEGFCVPLIEALGLGLPVVARAAGAVPETLAGAGIVIEDDDLAVFAEALHAVTTSDDLRTRLRSAATRRLREVRSDVVAAQIRDFVLPVVGA